jgi:hypothetical protein
MTDEMRLPTQLERRPKDGDRRQAKVRGYAITWQKIAAYLPFNYKIVRMAADEEGLYVLIEGVDNAGWSLDGYVIPRLLSGGWACAEVEA